MNRGKRADVAELADAHDSKSCGAIRAGSSPATGTSSEIPNTAPFPPYGENCALLGISSLPNRTRCAGLRFGAAAKRQLHNTVRTCRKDGDFRGDGNCRKPQPPD